MDSTVIRNGAEQLIPAWETAELPRDLVEPVKAAYERYNELASEVVAVETSTSAVFKDVAAQVAAGLPLGEGIAELAKRSAASERISQASSAKRGRALFERSRSVCLKVIREHLEQNAAALFAACDEAEESGAKAVPAVRAALGRLGLVNPTVSVPA